MGLDGPAEVVAINPCSPIEPDDGTGRQIVTGLMAHPADNILDISITGLDEPLGVTTTHPIWSETRQQFVKAAHLEVGEHLRSETGAISQITSITPHRGPPQYVYNLEVNAEHVYQVGLTGLLVHNDCTPKVFWSGTGSKDAAEKYAQEIGGQTLEMSSIGKKAAEAAKKAANDDESLKIWENASRQFAEGANGPVHIFENGATGTRLSTVLRRIEIPVLQGKGATPTFHVH